MRFFLRQVRFGAFLGLLVPFFACQGVGTRTKNSYDTVYAPTYASHFVVLSSGSDTLLRVIDPWQGAKGVVRDYPVSGRGFGRVVAMSSSHTAFIEALGCSDLVVGVSGPQYISSAAFSSLPDVGYDNNLNFELIVSLAPDLFTTYEISGENSAAVEKLRSLGIDPLYVADYLEQSALAKAEWVVAFGALMGEFGRSIDIFQKVEHRYDSLRRSVAARIDSLGVSRPVVMLNSPYNDVWYMPSDDSYFVSMIDDAGGSYVGRGWSGNVSRAVSIEAAYALLAKSDVWLNPSAATNSVADLETANALLGRVAIPVYNNTARGGRSGGSDFWESGVLRCDIALADLVSMLYPEMPTDHKLYYYKRLR